MQPTFILLSTTTSAENAKSVNGSNNGTGLKRRGDEVGLSSREDVECEPASSAVMDGIVTDTGAGSASIFGRPEGAAEVRASLDRRGRSIFSNQVEGNQQSGPLGDDVKGGEAGVLGVANLDAQNDALPHSILNFRVLK